MPKTLELPSLPEASGLPEIGGNVGTAVAQTAIEEIMRTDPVAAFEFPEHVIKAGNDITYTPPSGDQ